MLAYYLRTIDSLNYYNVVMVSPLKIAAENDVVDADYCVSVAVFDFHYQILLRMGNVNFHVYCLVFASKQVQLT